MGEFMPLVKYVKVLDAEGQRLTQKCFEFVLDTPLMDDRQTFMFANGIDRMD